MKKLNFLKNIILIIFVFFQSLGFALKGGPRIRRQIHKRPGKAKVVSGHRKNSPRVNSYHARRKLRLMRLRRGRRIGHGRGKKDLALHQKHQRVRPIGRGLHKKERSPKAPIVSPVVNPVKPNRPLLMPQTARPFSPLEKAVGLPGAVLGVGAATAGVGIFAAARARNDDQSPGRPVIETRVAGSRPHAVKKVEEKVQQPVAKKPESVQIRRSVSDPIIEQVLAKALGEGFNFRVKELPCYEQDGNQCGLNAVKNAFLFSFSTLEQNGDIDQETKERLRNVGFYSEFYNAMVSQGIFGAANRADLVLPGEAEEVGNTVFKRLNSSFMTSLYSLRSGNFGFANILKPEIDPLKMILNFANIFSQERINKVFNQNLLNQSGSLVLLKQDLFVDGRIPYFVNNACERNYIDVVIKKLALGFLIDRMPIPVILSLGGGHWYAACFFFDPIKNQVEIFTTNSIVEIFTTNSINGGGVHDDKYLKALGYALYKAASYVAIDLT